MLFSLNKKSRKYDCEICVNTPDSFLHGIIQEYISVVSKVEHCTQEIAIENNTKYEDLEHKLNQISVLLGKYDFTMISENLLKLGSDLVKGQSTLNENIGNMKLAVTEQKINNKNCVDKQVNLGSSNHEMVEELETERKKVNAYQNSYEIIMETVNERDREIKRIGEQKEKKCHKIHKKRTEKW